MLWTALVLILMPDGQILATHNSHAFRTYDECAAHVNRATAKLEIPYIGFCFDTMGGQDI